MARTPELHQAPYTREHGLPPTQEILKGIKSRKKDVPLFECYPKPDGSECASAVRRVLIRHESQTNGIGIIIPKVWAAKCDDCGTVGFQNEVATQIDTKAFDILERYRMQELQDWYIELGEPVPYFLKRT